MKFVHFTAPDGSAVAVSDDGNVFLRPAYDAAEGGKTAIVTQAGTQVVREPMAKVEERLKTP